MVEIITQWPGHAAEEVERLITVPVEIGHERHSADRRRSARSRSTACPTSSSPSRTAPTTISPARKCSTACGDLSLPDRRDAVGVAAVLAVGPDLSLCAAKPRPLADGAQDLRGLDDRAAIQIRARRRRRFRFRRRHDAVSGAARSGQGRRRRPVGGAGRSRRSPPTTAMPAAASIRRAASSITCAAWAASRRWRTSATSCWRCTTARRCWSRMSAASSSASRRAWASSAIEKQDDAVEGVILLRTGEKTQDVLKGVEAKTKRTQRPDPAQGRQGRSVLRPHRPDRR